MSEPEKTEDLIARIRAAGEAVDEAIKLAARVAERNHRGRGDFLQRAEQLWDELFETEEAREEKRKQRMASWARFMAEMHSPENVAAREADKAAYRAREDAAKAARDYPVLIPAKALGKVLEVHADGLVRLGFMARGQWDQEFTPEDGDAGRVIRFEGGGACPEQYDAFIGEQRVGYVRLRHGTLRVDYPECGGERVLDGCPMGDGTFEPEERPEWLDKARAALYETWYGDWHDASDEDIEAEVHRQHAADAVDKAEREAREAAFVARVKGGP